jgi:hypothetical protein
MVNGIIQIVFNLILLLEVVDLEILIIIQKVVLVDVIKDHFHQKFLMVQCQIQKIVLEHNMGVKYHQHHHHLKTKVNKVDQDMVDLNHKIIIQEEMEDILEEVQVSEFPVDDQDILEILLLFKESNQNLFQELTKIMVIQ